MPRQALSAGFLGCALLTQQLCGGLMRDRERRNRVNRQGRVSRKLLLSGASFSVSPLTLSLSCQGDNRRELVRQDPGVLRGRAI